MCFFFFTHDTLVFFTLLFRFSTLVGYCVPWSTSTLLWEFAPNQCGNPNAIAGYPFGTKKRILATSTTLQTAYTQYRESKRKA